MFKPNPKALVSLKFNELFGKSQKHKVVGTRLSPLECKAAGYPSDTFVAELIVDNTVLATARARDWRKAYKLLVLEVERLYTEGPDYISS